MDKFNYSKRDFNGIRSELINYAKTNYGVEFTPASLDLLLVDMISGVGDMLSYNTDKKFNETQLETIQERKNLLAYARTYGLKIPNKRASITVCTFSITVPVKGDTYDDLQTPIIKMGAQVMGGGQIFETVNDIDFNDDFSATGVPNRRILPNISGDEEIVSYTIIKEEIVHNGVTKIGRKTISTQDYKPFLSIIIPEDDVLSIEQVIQLPSDTYGYNVMPPLSEFFNEDNRFYEVPSLVEDKLFLDDNVNTNPNPSSGISMGKYKEITKKFLMEYTDNGHCKLIFGGGKGSNDITNTFLESINTGNLIRISNYLNNDTLGEIPKVGHTLYYRYRSGGGANTNIGQNVLTNMGTYTMSFSNGDVQAVKNSLRVNNPIPALGGSNGPSLEEIRRQISYNFASQNRCVTIRDYMSKVFEMPGRYGAPFRISGREDSNKIVLSILSLGSDGSLTNQSNNILRNNIAEYLSKFRMVNDFVEIEDGKIINLGVEVDILIDRAFNRSEINLNVINVIKKYFDINSRDMNENIYMGDLIEKINNVNGVLNIIDIRVFNKVGGGYSNNEINMTYSNNETREIELVDYTIFGEMNGMFEIKQPSRDIIIRNKIN